MAAALGESPSLWPLISHHHNQRIPPADKGLVVLVISLCGLASAAAVRAPQRSDQPSGRLYNADALHNEINDLILPLLGPRRKNPNPSSKPPLQLTELLTDPQHRNKPYVLSSFGKQGEKTRDKPVAILVADLPRGAKAREELDDTAEEVDSQDSDNEELNEGSDSETQETQEVDRDQRAHPDEAVNAQVHDWSTADDEAQGERTADEDVQGGRTADEEVEGGRTADEEVEGGKTADEDVEGGRTADEEIQGGRTADAEVQEERTANKFEQQDARNDVVPLSDEEIAAVRVAGTQEQKAQDQALDESLSSLKSLSHDIASALSARVDHQTEAADEERVLECVERKGSAVSEPPSAEIRVAETEYRRVPTAEAEYHHHVPEAEFRVPEAESQAPADYWKYYRAETRAGDDDSAWAQEEPHAGPHKAYNLSFSFTK